MNESTEGVTLWAAFIQDVLREVEKTEIDSAPLLKMAEGQDIKNPFNFVPMQLYNDMCAWVEQEVGKESLVQIGRNIGETVFTSMEENGLMDENSSPIEIMDGLIVAAESMVSDPEGRGWEILKDDSNSLHLKRTQTFNSTLQLGLLEGLIKKSGVQNLEVQYVKEVAKGEEFDEYLVTWEG